METAKIKGHARKETIKKYNIYIKSALIKIEKDPFCFNQIEFLRDNKLTSNFFRALVELKILASTKEGKNVHYLILVPWTQLTEEDGKRVAEYSLAYNYDHTNTPPNWLDKVKDCCEQSFSLSRSKLSKYTDDQLLDELRDRGYSGDINRVQTIKL